MLEPIPVRYLEWSNIESIIAIAFSCLGILVTLFVTLIFVLYWNTPVVSLQPGALLHHPSWHLLGCVCPLHHLLPSPPSLYLLPAAPSNYFSSAMCYSALVMETNTPYPHLSWQQEEDLYPEAEFMSAWAQVIIASILISVQLTLVITWSSWSPMPILSPASRKSTLSAIPPTAWGW